MERGKKPDKNKKKDDLKKREHEPTNAEITMKALQGTGAYEEDEDDLGSSEVRDQPPSRR